MTPKEEELLGGSDGHLSTLVASTTTASPSLTTATLTQIDGIPSDRQISTGLLDNSAVVQDNLQLPSTNETNMISNVKRGVKLDSLSPSKSEKSSTSDNDTSEMPSQKSLDSMGSSFDCTHLKETASPLALSTAGAELLEPCPAVYTKNLLGRSCKPDSDISEDVDKTTKHDFEDDAFLLAEASSVFCTCASGHPFVVDPRSLSEVSASPMSYPGETLDSTTTTTSCGTVLSEKERCTHDLANDCPSSYILEPNLHLPNERCTRSQALDEEENGKAFSCSNFTYDHGEEYFKNDFIQDTYPILSPQQIPYQVLKYAKSHHKG